MQEFILFILLLLSAFFSGSETALVSLSSVQIEKLKKNKSKSAKTIIKLQENSKKTLITILICNNIVNTGAAALATLLAQNYFGNNALSIAIGGMTFLILVFGEVLPKNFSAIFNEKISLFVARPLKLIQTLIMPLVWLVEGINHAIFRIAGVKEPNDHMTKEDLESAISLSKEAGSLDKHSLKIMEEVLEFNATRVEDIMTPEQSVFSVNGMKTLKEVKNKLVEENFSRIPIYIERQDNYIGILHINEVLKRLARGDEKIKIKDLKLTPLFVIPESKQAGKLLRDFQSKRNHIAIVVDEHGQIEGIVTLEDVIEELVGDILDETDSEEGLIEKFDKYFLIDGKTQLELINKKLKLKLEGEASNLNGYVIDALGRVPKKGEKIKVKNRTIEIFSSSKTRIKRAKIYK